MSLWLDIKDLGVLGTMIDPYLGMMPVIFYLLRKSRMPSKMADFCSEKHVMSFCIWVIVRCIKAICSFVCCFSSCYQILPVTFPLRSKVDFL